MSLINREEAIEKILAAVNPAGDRFSAGIAHGLRVAVVVLSGLPSADAEEKHDEKIRVSDV